MMKTTLCGIAVLYLLLILIHDDNMKTEALPTKLARKTIKWMKCCLKNCKINDVCHGDRDKPPSKGCRCWRKDGRRSEGGYWTFY